MFNLKNLIMKKLIVSIIVIVFALSLSGCGNDLSYYCGQTPVDSEAIARWDVAQIFCEQDYNYYLSFKGNKGSIETIEVTKAEYDYYTIGCTYRQIECK